MVRIPALLKKRFGGVIRKGAHEKNGQCCILEYRCAKLGLKWSDEPSDARTFDIRHLNDGPWSTNKMRTEWMLKLEKAVGGSLDWPAGRQRRFVELVVQRTTKEIGAAGWHKWRRDDLESQAAESAWKAADEAGKEAVSGKKKKAEEILIAACKIWIEAAKATEPSPSGNRHEGSPSTPSG